MKNDHIQVNCLELTQPIGTYYVATMDWQQLESIAYSDIRRIIEEKGGHRKQYLGIQRELREDRVNEIAKYVNLIDATFPTSIILAIDSESVINYDQGNKILTIMNEKDVAKIIDGQHRIAGLKKGNPKKTFELSVTIFIDMELEDQALTFATINKAQTKVNKSIVYDLFAYAKSRSPQKTCHQIVRALHEMEGSPFYERIKILGKAVNKQETITQATFAEQLISYISREPEIDRDLEKRGKRVPAFEGKQARDYFLRSFYIRKQDDDIALILWNYFSAVRDRWPNAWEINERGNILNRSTGFIALMRFLRDAYWSIYEHKNENMGYIPSKKEFNDFIFNHINLDANSFTPQNYEPGSSGQSKLYRELKSSIGIK